MRRLYLHVGMMKTGTTFVQSVLRANHRKLAKQDVYFPAGKHAPVQAFAVWDLVGRRPRGAPDDRIAGQWDALTDAVSRSTASTVLLSEEYLAAATVRQARRAVAGFPDHEVHIIVTARDLGRVLASAWQESIKNGARQTWPQFVTAVRDPEAITRDPARGFWLRHDLPAVVDVWAAAAGRERVHVVTVPPAGSPPELLLSRIGDVVGFAPARLTNPPRVRNESLGAPMTEVVRRLNEQLDNRLNQRQYDWVVKRTLQRLVPAAGTSERFVLPAEHLDWATAEAQRMIGQVRVGGYDVAGDLDDLLPLPASGGRNPDQVDETELLETSVRSLAVLAEEYAGMWWEHLPPHTPRVPAGSRTVRAVSGARGAAFRVRRRAAEVADHNRVAASAMGVYLRARAAARRRMS